MRLTSRSSEQWKAQCENGKNWTQRARNPEPTENTKIGATAQLKYALKNPGSAHGGRLPEIIQQFSWFDVIVIPGTRMSRRKAPKDGELTGYNTTRSVQGLSRPRGVTTARTGWQASPFSFPRSASTQTAS